MTIAKESALLLYFLQWKIKDMDIRTFLAFGPGHNDSLSAFHGWLVFIQNTWSNLGAFIKIWEPLIMFGLLRVIFWGVNCLASVAVSPDCFGCPTAHVVQCQQLGGAQSSALTGKRSTPLWSLESVWACTSSRAVCPSSFPASFLFPSEPSHPKCPNPSYEAQILSI